MPQVKWRRRVPGLTSPEDWLQALANHRLERREHQGPRVPHSCRELGVLLRHRVLLQVRRRRVRRELRVRAEAAVLAPLDYQGQPRPDSLPAGDFVQPAVVVAAVVVDFRADSARRKLARRR